MSTIRLPYIHSFRDRHGRQRYYFRRQGFKRIPLPGAPGSKEFIEAYQRAVAGETAPAMMVGASRARPGTISALVIAYFNSPDFRQLAAQTKITYRRIIEGFQREHGDKPVQGLQPIHIRRIVNARAAKPVVANMLLRMIHTLMSFAVIHEWRSDDPTLGIKKFRQRTEGYHTWTEEEIAQFESRWPVGTKERLAFDLLLYTAQRSSDVRVLGRQHMRGEVIELRQQKTGTRVTIPVHPSLKRSLEAHPSGGITFLLQRHQKPFSAAGFSNWFGEAVRAAGLPVGVSAHGLRKAHARRLAEAGCSTQQIMAITGHLSLKEVERYTRAADKAALAKQAMDRFGSGKPLLLVSQSDEKDEENQDV